MSPRPPSPAAPKTPIKMWGEEEGGSRGNPSTPSTETHAGPSLLWAEPSHWNLCPSRSRGRLLLAAGRWGQHGRETKEAGDKLGGGNLAAAFSVSPLALVPRGRTHNHWACHGQVDRLHSSSSCIALACLRQTPDSHPGPFHTSWKVTRAGGSPPVPPSGWRWGGLFAALWVLRPASGDRPRLLLCVTPWASHSLSLCASVSPLDFFPHLKQLSLLSVISVMEAAGALFLESTLKGAGFFFLKNLPKNARLGNLDGFITLPGQ